MLKPIVYAVGAVLVMDWIVVGNFAAIYGGFDLRYWRFTWARLITVAIAMITAALMAVMFNPETSPIWPLFVAIIVFGLWFVVAVDEVARQRAIGWRKPPRYSRSDDY